MENELFVGRREQKYYMKAADALRLQGELDVLLELKEKQRASRNTVSF